MTDYLDRTPDFNTPEVVSAYDELPLWSAPFGLLLLDRVRLGAGITVLDVGCGTGFPLFELAQRLGPSSTVYGIDTWQAALERARRKAEQYAVTNVRIVEGDAAATPFEDRFFDRIVSNLGINNFEDPDRVLQECRRILKPGGRLSLTSNFTGHMAEFYAVYERTLTECGLEACRPALAGHVEHRSTMAALCARLEAARFQVTGRHEASFRIRFHDGSALLRHSFIRLGFLPAWKEVVPAGELERVFQRLEQNLNAEAAARGELSLTVPYGYVEAVRR
jgi:arsenite methyltransferase